MSWGRVPDGSDVVEESRPGSAEPVPVGRLERPFSAMQVGLVAFILSAAAAAVCVSLKVDGVFVSRWSVVLLPVWLLHVTSILSFGVAVAVSCPLLFRPQPAEASEGPRLVIGTVLTAWFGLVAAGLVVLFEVMLASALDGGGSLSSYELAAPLFVLAGLLLCNTVLCATRNAYSLLSAVCASAAIVLICLKAEGRVDWSWWLVLFPVAAGCVALATMMAAVKLQAGGSKPRYKLTALQNRALLYYILAAILSLLSVVLFALRQDVRPLRDNALQPEPFVMTVALVPFVIGLVLFAIPAAEVMSEVAAEALREGRLTHTLPGAKYDIDGGEEWWLLLGRVEVLAA